MLFDFAMNDPFEHLESMPFRCPGCQSQPSWYQRYRLIAVGCQCAAVTWDYQQLPFFPQTDEEWEEWLSLAKLDLDAHFAAEIIWFESNGCLPLHG